MAEDLTVVFNHFFEIASQMNAALSQVVEDTARNVRSIAAGNAPVETGFMSDAIYFKTIDQSSYGAGGGAPTEDAYLLPEVATPPDMFTAYVAAGANYSAFVNYGHHTRSGSFVPPQPFWEPSVEAARPGFEAALSDIESRLQ